MKGVLLGVDLRMDSNFYLFIRKKNTCLQEIRLYAQGMLTMLGSMVNIIACTIGETCMTIS